MREGESFSKMKEMHLQIKQLESNIKVLEWNAPSTPREKSEPASRITNERRYRYVDDPPPLVMNYRFAQLYHLTIFHIITIDCKPDYRPYPMPTFLARRARIHVQTIKLIIEHYFQNMRMAADK